MFLLGCPQQQNVTLGHNVSTENWLVTGFTPHLLPKHMHRKAVWIVIACYRNWLRLSTAHRFIPIIMYTFFPSDKEDLPHPDYCTDNQQEGLGCENPLKCTIVWLWDIACRNRCCHHVSIRSSIASFEDLHVAISLGSWAVKPPVFA